MKCTLLHPCDLQDLNFVIIVPADSLESNGTRPSAGKVLTTLLHTLFCIFFKMTFFISNDIFPNIQWDLGILHSMKYGFLCTFLIWGMEELIAHWPSLWCIFNWKHAKMVQNHPGVASIRMTLARLGHLYTLWPSDTIWRHRSGSTLPQVMAWCLTAPNHYQNLCWLPISEVLWHSP